MKKPAIIFFALMLFALVALFIIATGFLSTDKNISLQTKDSKNPSDFFFPSLEFQRIEKALLNSSNITSTSDSINQLTNSFEKNYLTALSSKRKSEYRNSFNLLYPMLSSYPKHYPFYDELIFSAKASSNLKQIEQFINKEKSHNEYLYYFKALYFYHTNQYSKSIELLKDNNDFQSQYLLSYSYRGIGDYDNALKVLNNAEILLQRNSYEVGKVLISKGSLYLLSGNYDEAKKLYIKGLESAKQSGNRIEEVKALINLAILDDQNGNVDEAKFKLESAYKISKKIEDKELQATALSEIAVSYTYSGNVVEAKNNYEESFKTFKILNHKERLSNLCANIASLYSQTANYSSAIEYYNNGLDYSGDNVVSKVLNLRGLGDVYANLSNYSKSLEFYQIAKELAHQVKDISTESSVDVSIGTLYYNINKPIKALQIFLEAKDKIDSESDPYAAEDIYFKIGLAYSKIDSFHKSNDALLNALSLSEVLSDVYYKTIISTELGYNYFLQKDLIKAENIITRSMQVSKNYSFDQLLGMQNLYLGRIALAENNLGNAITYFNKASSLAANELDYNNVFESEYLLAKSYLIQNKPVETEEHFLKAIELTDKISESLINNAEIQIAHFSGINDCYSDLTEMYIKQNRNEEAFSIAEKSHSRNTFQNLSNLRINSSGISSEKLNEYYDLKWMVESGLFSGSKLEELNSDFQILKNKFEQKIVPATSTIREFSLSNLQNNLSADENLITLFFSGETLYFFKLNKANYSLERSGLTKNAVLELLKKIAPLYDSEYHSHNLYFNQDLFSFNTKAANEFYIKVLQPTINNIPKGQKLIFSLPSELVYVPFEFLVTEFNEDDSPFYYANKKYLIDDYAISYSPSSSIYILQKQTKKSFNEKVLLVGDPQISNKDFSLSYRGGLLEDDSFNARNIVLFPLKYSKEEIQNVNSMFSNGYVLLSIDATEKRFKENAAQSSIIHLSTHSFLYKNQPLIIFSQNKNESEDGYLERGEILQLKLNSDLVVLSSCRSGLGEVDKAEGIIGMQKSFFEAGAKSVVVSLWDVNDKYTSLFMQSFYKYLSEGFDKSESMQKAKLFFKKNYSANPYYWSAFILSGDVSKINTIKASTANYLLYILVGFFISILAIYFALRKTSLS